MTSNARLVGLDIVRSTAMLLGVAYHATFAYVPNIGPWYPVVDVATDSFFAVLGTFLHAFRMEVFFALSGFFSRLLLEKRGPRQFLRERARRLLVPFAVALPLSMATDWLCRRASDAHRTLAADYAWHTEWRLAPLHLWFLEYLFLFCVLLVVVHRFAPRGAAWLGVLGVVPSLILAWFSADARPDLSFMPQLEVVAHHGLFFALGVAAWSLRDTLARFRHAAITLAGIGAVIALWVSSRPLQWQPLGHVLLCASAWFITAGVLSWGLASRVRDTLAIRFFVDAAYWVYLCHYPLVVLAHVALATVWLPAALKYLAVIAATLALTGVTFQRFIRPSALAPWLGAKGSPTTHTTSTTG